MFKRGQNWSIEMIVTSALFVTFFVTFISLSYVATNSDLQEVELLSDELAQRLITFSDPAGIVDERSGINKSKLLNLSTLSYEELKTLYGLSEDFCILLEDDRGNIVLVGGKYGVGSSNIQINSVRCGDTP